MLGKGKTVGGVETGKRVTLMVAPLEGGGGFTPLFDETFLGGADATIRFVGNRLYFAVQSFLADGSVNLTITCYDRTDGTSQVLFEQTDITYIAGDMWVTEAGEIYMPVLVENVGQVLKLEDGAWTEVMSLEGENVAAPTILDGIVEFDGVTEGTRWVHIFTSSGETAYEGALFPEAIPGIEEDPNTLSLAIVGGDREKLSLCLESWNGSGSIDDLFMLALMNNMDLTYVEVGEV